MRSARSLMLAAGLMGLTACSTADSQPPVLTQVFVGAWSVVHAWPAGPVVGSPAPEGQTVAITPTTAADPLGRNCTEPTYTVAPGLLSTALGIDAPSSEQGLVLDVMCGSRPFARYVANGTRLLSVADGWLFELRPAAMAAGRPTPVVAAPVTAPARAPVKPQAAKPTHRPMGGEILYLASYRSQDTAMAGWKVLQSRVAALKDLQPTFKEVDLGAKGRFVRLYAAGASAEAQSRICATLGKTSPDCGARY